MNQTQFVKRIAATRARFASKLADKIQQTDAAWQQLAGNGSDAVDAVAEAYRRFHDVAGTGPTIGFEASGRSARALEAILIGPFRAHRGLSADELAELKRELDALRGVAQTELQSTHSDRELSQ